MVVSAFSLRCLIALALSPVLGAALTAQDVAPVVVAPPPAAANPVFLEVQEKRLSNGLQVLMVQTGPRAGDALHLRLLVRGGASATADLPSAAAGLLAHSLFEGTPGKRPDPELEKLLLQEEGLCESLRLRSLRRNRFSEDRALQDEPLEQLHLLKKDVLEQVRKRLAVEGGDVLGGSRSEIFVEADVLGYGQDLSKSAFEAWARMETERLKRLDLARLPLVREAQLRAFKDADKDRRQADSWLLNTAFPGRHYARALENGAQSLESVPYSALRFWARTQMQPERMALVLVGHLDTDRMLSVLQNTLGRLEPSTQTLRGSEDCLPPLEVSDSFRKLSVSTSGESLLRVGWPIPQASHPDEAALRVLARILDQRVRAEIVDKGLGKNPQIQLGFPGWRQESLLALSLSPTVQTSLGQLEEALWAITLDLQRRLVDEAALNRAQMSLESDLREMREDARLLATFVGEGWVQGVSCEGRLRERAWSQINPQMIQQAAQRYLGRLGSTTVLQEADPILSPKDPQEARLVKALRNRLASKVENPARLENVVRETLRQLRMLTDAERASTLTLLEAQGEKGK